MKRNSDVSIVTVNYGTPELIRQLLDSLEGHRDRDRVREVVVVDNGYPEMTPASGSVQEREEGPSLRFVRNEKHSYSSGINLGVAATTGRYVVLANSDISFHRSGTLEPLLEVLSSDESIGVVGPQLLFPDGGFQRSYGAFPGPRTAFWEAVGGGMLAGLTQRLRRRSGSGRPFDVGYIDGAFMVVKRDVFLRVGGFDERFGFYCEDADFCKRLRGAGLRSVFVPGSLVTHIRGGSSTLAIPARYSARLIRAKASFVTIHSTRRAVGVYLMLEKCSAMMRALLYSVADQLYGDGRFRKLASKANAVRQAVCSLDLSRST